MLGAVLPRLPGQVEGSRQLAQGHCRAEAFPAQAAPGGQEGRSVCVRALVSREHRRLEVAHVGRSGGRSKPRLADNFLQLREGVVPEFSRPSEVAASVRRLAEHRVDEEVPVRA